MLRANKKASSGQGLEGAPYYIDEMLKKSVDMELESTLRRFNTLKNDFERIASHKIENFEEFTELLENPIEFYRSKHLAKVENSELIKQLKALNLDAERLIELPSGFDQVISQCTMINRGGSIRPDRWTIENEKIVATEEHLQKLYRRVYFYAQTKEQKQRLEISLKMIEAFRLIESEIHKQLPQHRAGEAIRLKMHFRNKLPYQLKAVNDREGVRIIPSPEWVQNGFEGTSFLGYHVQNESDKIRAKRDAEAYENRKSRRAPQETILSYNDALPDQIYIDRLTE